jgi:enoyl-CoA hydratase/carnithine racemase
MCGEGLTGERAYQLGLVSELAEEGQALNRALELARKLTRMPAIKRALRQGSDLPLPEALRLEQDEFLQLFDTADQTEGHRKLSRT